MRKLVFVYQYIWSDELQTCVRVLEGQRWVDNFRISKCRPRSTTNRWLNSYRFLDKSVYHDYIVNYFKESGKWERTWHRLEKLGLMYVQGGARIGDGARYLA